MKVNLNFQGVGGFKPNKHLWGGMDISWNHTLQGYMYVNKIVGEKEELAIETRINMYMYNQQSVFLKNNCYVLVTKSAIL